MQFTLHRTWPCGSLRIVRDRAVHSASYVAVRFTPHRTRPRFHTATALAARFLLSGDQPVRASCSSSLTAVSLPPLTCDCTAVFTAVSCRPLAWRSRASLGTSVTCSCMLRALSCLVSALVRAAVLHRRTLARCRLRFLLRFHAARSHAALPLLAAYCAAREVHLRFLTAGTLLLARVRVSHAASRACCGSHAASRACH